MILTINEQKHELHFGMKALEVFFKSAGTVEEGSIFQSEQVTAIVWGGLINGAYRQQKSLPISFAEVVDWVEAQMWDEAGQEQLKAVLEAFNESQAVKKMAEKTGEEVKKKKPRTLKPA